jgi:putative zinc finger/helix-turn-helix YgiT family protein
MKAEKFCPTCEDYRPFTSEERVETFDVRGYSVALPVTAEVCEKCHEILFDEVRDQALIVRAYAEYRAQENLLSPEEIRETREQWRLTKESFALLIGISEQTLKGYENGSLQDHLHDELIRACRHGAVIADLLARHGHLLSEKQRQRASAALAAEDQRRSKTVRQGG